MHPHRVLRLIQEAHADLIEKRQQCSLEFQRQIDQNELDQALLLCFLGRKPGIYTSAVLHDAGYIDNMCGLTSLGIQRLQDIVRQYDPVPVAVK